jgi:hypothetical protein
MTNLSRQIAQLETRLGELAGEIAELRAEMDPFVARYRTEVLVYQEEMAQVEREIADVKAILGDRQALGSRGPNPALDFLPKNYVPADEQYRRVWKGGGPAKPTGPKNLTPATLTLKKLYAEVIALLHPELAHDPREYQRREALMRKINDAYVQRNEPALQAMLDAHKDRSNLPALVDERVLKELRNQITDMEVLIGKLEGEHYELRYGEVAYAKAEADRIAPSGRDLIAEIRRDLQHNLMQARQELADLKALL